THRMIAAMPRISPTRPPAARSAFRMPGRHARQYGFTLLEMAVVIAVIGLVIGGIVVGKELVRNTKVNSVLTDLEKYKVAVESFQLVHSVLPGDMPDAYTYWPSAGCTDADVNATESGCNGNGDGTVGTYAACYRENYRFWQ